LKTPLKILFGTVLFFTFTILSPRLPSPLFQVDYSTVLLSRSNALLGAHITDDQQWRFPPSAQVPEKFAQALIFIEDKRFYQHWGVDFLALLRAVYSNLREQRVVSGASTLSMQVIRLASGQPRRTYLEKLREVWLAWQLEWHYSKAEILALYAAHAPFGGNVVGLEAAAWRYFGRGSQDLSWAESALLAVLPNNPALLHLGRNRAALQAKRDALLGKLHDQGLLSEVDWQLALFEPLPNKPQSFPRLAPHLLASLKTQKTHSKQVFQSHLDASLQQHVTQSLNRHSQRLQQHRIYNAAALVIDNQNMQVLAYVGNSQSLRQDQGHAIDMLRQPRSTGSLLKPFLYALMLQAGELTPSMLVADTPQQYGNFRPQNYDRRYRGAVSAKQALALSLNLPAMQLLQEYGINRFHAFLREAGFESLKHTPEHYGLSLVLGGAEASLWQLASLYARLAHRVVFPQTDAFIPNVSVGTLTGTLHVPSQSMKRENIDPGAAWLTLQALLEVARPDTEAYWHYFQNTRKVAWKTGTSFGHRDAWAIGVTPAYTVAVWVGNASGNGRPELIGVDAAAPLLFNIFQQLPPTTWFKRPHTRLKEIEVCANDGFLANGYCNSRSESVPATSHFKRLSPHNRRIHLDASGRWQVHSGCEAVADMQHRNWFILPPHQAFYYQQSHLDYRSVPPYRDDCQVAGSRHMPLDVVYPPANSQIMIPIDLDGRSSQVVFQAVHRQPKQRLFWHLNEEFLGSTEHFHQWVLAVSEGKHRLIVLDEQGRRVERVFEVLYGVK